MAVKCIKKITYTGTGSCQVLDRPFVDNRFRVDMALVRVTATIKNTNAAAQNMLAETFGHNWLVDWKYADGKKWYDSVSFAAAERIFEQTRQNYLELPIEFAKSATPGPSSTATPDTYPESVTAAEDALSVNALERSYRKSIRDRRITAVSSATEDVSFRLALPLARPFASRPTDYSQSLSLLGQLTVKLTNDTGDSDLTVTQFVVEVWVIGEYVDNFFAGIRVRHWMQGSNVPNTSDSVNLDGKRLLALHVYTTDNAGSPIDGESPEIKLDNDNILVSLQDGQNVTELNDLTQVVDSPFPDDSERVSTEAVLLVGEPYKHSIFDLPQSTAVQLHYSTNPGTAGEHILVASAAFEKSDRCRKAFYPGAKNITPNELLAMTRIVGRTPTNDAVLEAQRDWLPEEVMTPEARGGACG